MREGLEQVLAGQPSVEVVGSCADLPSLLETIEAEQPDVVLTDIRMPPSMTDEGIQVAALLRQTHPSVGVVVLSQYSEPSYALALLESGSDGRAYLLKERVHDRAQLLSALEDVAEGGSVIDSKIVDVLVSARARAERSPLAELTQREREVLAEIARGKSNSAIAKSLVLTKRAVEKHINSIFSKLGLWGRGRQQAGHGRACIPLRRAGTRRLSLREGCTPSRRAPAELRVRAPLKVPCGRHCRGRESCV
jgi:DNA-binding NarL/FixJ family response regulator